MGGQVVGVVGRRRHHGQDRPGARIDRHHGALEVAEVLRCGALRLGVERGLDARALRLGPGGQVDQPVDEQRVVAAGEL